MEEWLTIWESRDLFINGLFITLTLFVLSSVLAFLLACICLYALDNAHPLVRRVISLLINTMRALPYLILAYLIYYGLPQFGIRIDAFTSGLLSLVIYHGAYFTEIFRSKLMTLAKGQIEAAKAHGFKNSTIFRRIVLPNVVMKSLPLLANQLILCLKDTAFLSIITVKDITSAANTIQSIHFIPFKSFILAILFYWLITITIEQTMKRFEIISRERGFTNA